MFKQQLNTWTLWNRTIKSDEKSSIELKTHKKPAYNWHTSKQSQRQNKIPKPLLFVVCTFLATINVANKCIFPFMSFLCSCMYLCVYEYLVLFFCLLFDKRCDEEYMHKNTYYRKYLKLNITQKIWLYLNILNPSYIVMHIKIFT